MVEGAKITKGGCVAIIKWNRSWRKAPIKEKSSQSSTDNVEETATREDTTNSKSCGGRDLTKGPLSVKTS